MIAPCLFFVFTLFIATLLISSFSWLPTSLLDAHVDTYLWWMTQGKPTGKMRHPLTFRSWTIVAKQLFWIQAGGQSISLGLCPTKLPVIWDIQPGPLDVPAPMVWTVAQAVTLRWFHLNLSEQSENFRTDFEPGDLSWVRSCTSKLYIHPHPLKKRCERVELLDGEIMLPIFLFLLLFSIGNQAVDLTMCSEHKD